MCRVIPRTPTRWPRWLRWLDRRDWFPDLPRWNKTGKTAFATYVRTQEQGPMMRMP